MKEVTAIVISFLRPDYTMACIKSLKEVYPDIKIVVGENGDWNQEIADLCQTLKAKYIKLPFDSGVCVGRNRLIDVVDTTFVLVGDDDFFYTKETGVDRMLELIKNHPEMDLIGGRITEGGVLKNYQGSIERHGNYIVNIPINLEEVQYEYDKESNLRYIKADLTFNFFVAKTERIKDVPWDEQIKVSYEHLSWFIDLQENKRNVYFTPDTVVIHKPDHIRAVIESKEAEHDKYKTFRMRRTDKERFFTRHKLDFVIGMNGYKDFAPNSNAERILNKTTNDVKFVDFCVTTFKRPKVLERLLLSIAKHYPTANVYVADQNKVLDREFYKKLRNDLSKSGLIKRLSVEHLPYDCGISYARNHLVTSTPNKYKLILDDDMVFTEATDIGKMIKILESNKSFGIVGGALTQLNQTVNFEFNIEIENKVLSQVPDNNPTREFEGIRYRKTGCVLNFALFKSELFNYILWDNDLKVTEHLDFYVRMKKIPFNIAYTPDVVVDHPPYERSEDYKEFRQRDEFQKMMFKKHGIFKVKYLNGQVVELIEGDSFKRYKEKPNI
jgi:GT2 family glycosyltransferase